MCCVFFPCLNDHDYEITCILNVPITIAPRCFIEKLFGMTEIYRSRTNWAPVAYSSFRVYLLAEDEEKATDELQKNIILFSGKV